MSFTGIIFDLIPPDSEWLLEVGRRGWFVLTRDERIRYNPLERQAVQSAGIGMFLFVPKNLTGLEIAEIVVSALPAVERTAEYLTRPFIAKIYRDGRVERWV